MRHAGNQVSFNRTTMLSQMRFKLLKGGTDCSNHSVVMINVLKGAVMYPNLLMKTESKQLQPLVSWEVLCELGKNIGGITRLPCHQCLMPLIEMLDNCSHHVIWIQSTTDVVVELGSSGPNCQTNLGVCQEFLSLDLLEFSTNTSRACTKDFDGLA